MGSDEEAMADFSSKKAKPIGGELCLSNFRTKHLKSYYVCQILFVDLCSFQTLFWLCFLYGSQNCVMEIACWYILGGFDVELC